MSSAWHSRGYLPHWEIGEVPQSITFRLADSLPAKVLNAWRNELRSTPQEKLDLERRKRVEQALDRGYGDAHLGDPRVATVVEQAFLHFDAAKYRLHAWTIMPNHVHVIATPLGDATLSDIAHSWKGFTASKANELLGRRGTFWAPEYYDRAIRDEVHYAAAMTYVAMNPVKAGLCRRPEDWRFSSFWSGTR